MIKSLKKSNNKKYRKLIRDHRAFDAQFDSLFFTRRWIYIFSTEKEIVNPLAAITILYFCLCACTRFECGDLTSGYGAEEEEEAEKSCGSTLAWHNWCAKRALGGSSSLSVQIAEWSGLWTHESKWGENSFGNWNEYKFYFFFSSSILIHPPIPLPHLRFHRPSSGGVFLCKPSKSFHSMTVDVVGCYCNIKWKIPQQLFPAARSWLRHFPFLNVFNGIPSYCYTMFVCGCICRQNAEMCLEFGWVKYSHRSVVELLVACAVLTIAN